MNLIEAPIVAISAPCPAWEQALPEVEALAEATALLALRRGEAPAATVVDITLTDDEEQRTLNRTWRGKDAATNVLAFPAADPTVPVPDDVPLLLGDVVLAFETMRREAEEQEKPLADHLR